MNLTAFAALVRHMSNNPNDWAKLRDNPKYMIKSLKGLYHKSNYMCEYDCPDYMISEIFDTEKNSSKAIKFVMDHCTGCVSMDVLSLKRGDYNIDEIAEVKIMLNGLTLSELDRLKRLLGRRLFNRSVQKDSVPLKVTKCMTPTEMAYAVGFYLGNTYASEIMKGAVGLIKMGTFACECLSVFT